MSKSIGSITRTEFQIGEGNVEVTFNGSGFDATHSRNRVVLKLKETGAPSVNVCVSQPLRRQHTRNSLRVNIASDPPLAKELAQIREAGNRVFVPEIELLDHAQNVVDTIRAPAGLVMVFSLITSITPTEYKKGESPPPLVTFVGLGFDKVHYNNTVVLKPQGSDDPYEHIDIPKPEQDDDADTSTEFQVYITPKSAAQKNLPLVPTVEVEDASGKKIRTVHAVAGLVVKVV